MSTAAHERLFSLGFALTPFTRGTKGPRRPGWQDAPITTLEKLEPYLPCNVGILHGYSGTAALDIDHSEYSGMAFRVIGIDLEALLNAPGPKVHGSRGVKPLYRVPGGVELGLHQLRWQHPTEKDERGRSKPVTVFELRAGHGRQDVLPPSLHPNGALYTWQNEPHTQDDIPYIPDSLLELWTNWKKLEPTLKAACPWATHDPPTPSSARESLYTGDSVIVAYNAAHSLRETLTGYGFKQVSKTRFLPPESESGDAGAVILTGDDTVERVFVHNASSPLADEHAHDAFSLYCTYEHDGDVRAAVKSATRELGISGGSFRLIGAISVRGANRNVLPSLTQKPDLGYSVNKVRGGASKPRLGRVKPCL